MDKKFKRIMFLEYKTINKSFTEHLKTSHDKL